MKGFYYYSLLSLMVMMMIRIYRMCIPENAFRNSYVCKLS